MLECQDVLISPFTKIVNKSGSLGTFPRLTKVAFAKPVIKRTVCSFGLYIYIYIYILL